MAKGTKPAEQDAGGNDSMVEKIAHAMVRAQDIVRDRAQAAQHELLSAERKAREAIAATLRAEREVVYLLTAEDLLGADEQRRALAHAELSRLFDAERHFRAMWMLVVDARPSKRLWRDIPNEEQHDPVLTSSVDERGRGIPHDERVWWVSPSLKWKWIDTLFAREQVESLRFVDDLAVMITGDSKRDQRFFARGADGWREWSLDVSDEKLRRRGEEQAERDAAERAKQQRIARAREVLNKRPDLLLELAEKAGILKGTP